MPISWQARMMRTAISPRFAIRTLEKGALRRTSGASSLYKDGAVSERDVPMLLSRVRVALAGEHLQGGDQAGPRLGRLDHVVHIPARGRDVGVRELLLVLGHEAGSLGDRVFGRGQLVLEDDRDRAVGAHHR